MPRGFFVSDTQKTQAAHPTTGIPSTRIWKEQPGPSGRVGKPSAADRPSQ